VYKVWQYFLRATKTAPFERVAECKDAMEAKTLAWNILNPYDGWLN